MTGRFLSDPNPCKIVWDQDIHRRSLLQNASRNNTHKKKYRIWTAGLGYKRVWTVTHLQPRLMARVCKARIASHSNKFKAKAMGPGLFIPHMNQFSDGADFGTGRSLWLRVIPGGKQNCKTLAGNIPSNWDPPWSLKEDLCGIPEQLIQPRLHAATLHIVSWPWAQVFKILVYLLPGEIYMGKNSETNYSLSVSS